MLSSPGVAPRPLAAEGASDLVQWYRKHGPAWQRGEARGSDGFAEATPPLTPDDAGCEPAQESRRSVETSCTFAYRRPGPRSLHLDGSRHERSRTTDGPGNSDGMASMRISSQISPSQ